MVWEVLSGSGGDCLMGSLSGSTIAFVIHSVDHSLFIRLIGLPRIKGLRGLEGQRVGTGSAEAEAGGGLGGVIV